MASGNDANDDLGVTMRKADNLLTNFWLVGWLVGWLISTLWAAVAREVEPES